LAGLFGKWVVLPATIIVLGRVFFAALCLGFFLRLRGMVFRLNRQADYYHLLLLGVLLALHWVTFFRSIQLSTVAIGLLTFSTFPIFTTFLEPLFFRERLQARDVLLALITFAGVALVVPSFNLDDALTRGALWGIASGATFAVLSILNRRYVQQYPSRVIAFYQDVAATAALLPFYFVLQPAISGREWALLVLLGVVFTALSHTLFIGGLKSVKASTASVIGALEPVYGIVAAALLLQEMPAWRVLLGGVIILAATGYATWRPR
jgi:drug/metabolite transporter (DMT)-like permease